MTKSPKRVRRGARGSGSITHRKDGRWVGRYTIVLSNGKHKVKCVYAKTQSEARVKLSQQVAQRDRGEITDSNGTNVKDFYDIWINEIAPNYLRPTTIELYRRIYQKYILPILGKKKLANLNVSDAQKCFNLIRKQSEHQAQVAKKALSSMLVRAKKRQLIFINPARDIETPKIEAKAPDIWDKKQLKLFLTEAESTSPYYLAYALLANYGLRRGEVLGIRWQDVNLGRKCIHIRQQVVNLNNRPQIGPLKTTSSKRDLPLNEQLIDLLMEYRPHDNGLIFRTKNNTPLSPRNFYRDFQKVAERAGLPRIRLHAFRHMAACFMRDAGIDPKTCQSILGHATLNATLQIYQHSDMNHMKAASDKMGNLLLR